jgi:hypothetical protein
MTENDAFGETEGEISLDAPNLERDRDGVTSLRDTDEEQGDEAEVDDLYVFDETAAREVDADFNGDQRDEPKLS